MGADPQYGFFQVSYNSNLIFFFDENYFKIFRNTRIFNQFMAYSLKLTHGDFWFERKIAILFKILKKYVFYKMNKNFYFNKCMISLIVGFMVCFVFFGVIFMFSIDLKL